MRVHVDEGRPDVTRFKINCRHVGGCRRAYRFDRCNLIIVDEEVDKCRAVAIESCFNAAGQEADRNAGLLDPIALRFWYLERPERIHMRKPVRLSLSMCMISI